MVDEGCKAESRGLRSLHISASVGIDDIAREASRQRQRQARPSGGHLLYKYSSTMAHQQTSPPPPPPQWVLDLNSTPTSRPRSTNIPDPPGYSAAISGKVCNSHYLYYHQTHVFSSGPQPPNNNSSSSSHVKRPRPKKPIRSSLRNPGKSPWRPPNNFP